LLSCTFSRRRSNSGALNVLKMQQVRHAMRRVPMRRVAAVGGGFTAALSSSGVLAKNQGPCPSKTSMSSKTRLTVVLDMDECLIHSVFEEDAGYRQHEERPDGLAAAAGECEKFTFTMMDGAKCTGKWVPCPILKLGTHLYQIQSTSALGWTR
jgi:hypothetical protein